MSFFWNHFTVKTINHALLAGFLLFSANTFVAAAPSTKTEKTSPKKGTAATAKKTSLETYSSVEKGSGPATSLPMPVSDVQMNVPKKVTIAAATHQKRTTSKSLTPKPVKVAQNQKAGRAAELTPTVPAEAPPATARLEARLEKLEKELVELKSQSKKPEVTPVPVAQPKAREFEPVPVDQRDSIIRRLKIVEDLIKNHGQAYDYRMHTTQDLKRILAQLQPSPTPVPQLEVPAAAAEAPAESSVPEIEYSIPLPPTAEEENVELSEQEAARL